MSQRKIPDSVHAYLNDNAVQTAVDHLIDKKPSYLPEKLVWTEVPDYYRAFLSAQQVRVEFVLMFHELWDVVWKPVIGSSPKFSNMIPLIPSELADGDWINMSLESIWNVYGCMTQAFRDGDKNYGFSIGFRDNYKTGLHLSLYAWDDSDKDLFGSKLDRRWNTELDEEGWKFTQPNLVDISSRSIDLSELIQAAKMAIGSLEG